MGYKNLIFRINVFFYWNMASEFFQLTNLTITRFVVLVVFLPRGSLWQPSIFKRDILISESFSSILLTFFTTVNSLVSLLLVVTRLLTLSERFAISVHRFWIWLSATTYSTLINWLWSQLQHTSSLYRD